MSSEKAVLFLKFVGPAITLVLAGVGLMATVQGRSIPGNWIWAAALFVGGGMLIAWGFVVLARAHSDDQVVCAIERVSADMRDEINLGTGPDKRRIQRPICVHVSYSVRNAVSVPTKASFPTLTLLRGDVVEGWVPAPVLIHDKSLPFNRDLEIPAMSTANYGVELTFTVEDDFLPEILAGKLAARLEFDVIGAGPQEFVVRIPKPDTSLLTPPPGPPATTADE